MKQTKYFDGQDVLADDLDFDRDSTQQGIIDRSSDFWGVNAGFANGGFVSGGAVTPNGGDPSKIDIAPGIAYTALGERIDFPGATAVVLPDYTGAVNHLVLEYDTFTNTPVQHPVTGVVFQTRQQENPTFNFIGGSPLANQVPVANIAWTGGVGPLNIADVRVFPRNLGANAVDTFNIVDRAVTTAKLADYVKPIIWATPPDIYWDRDTQTLKSRRTGNFNLEGVVGNIVLSGFPLAIAEPTATVVVIGTITAGVCVVSTVSITDYSTLAKHNVIVLGFVDIDGTFVNHQAPMNDELMLLSEEDFSTASTRIKANENMWRRFNEQFQSFTPKFTDGAVSQPNAHKLNNVAGALQLTAGVSYVGGRRFLTANTVTLGVGNTESYGILTGTANFDIYILRVMDSGTFRYKVVGTGTPVPNAYLISTVPVVANVIGTPVDKRVFSPLPEASIIDIASEGIKVGARLRNTTAPSDVKIKVIIEPGIVGFSDGTIRQNKVQKILDFTAPWNAAVASSDQPNGYLQTQQGGSPLGLEPFNHYAIFAVADHAGNEFNIVAAKVPFIKNIAGVNLGGGLYQYTASSPSWTLTQLFYPGQKIRATRSDFTGVQSIGFATEQPGTTEYTQDSAVSPEVVQSVVGNVVTTQIGSLTPLTNFTGGTLTTLNKFRPDPALTGISQRYRLLGFISTDGTSMPNTQIRIFSADENKVMFPLSGTFQNKVAATGSTSQEWNLDMAVSMPVCAKIGTMNWFIGFIYDGAEISGANAQSCFAGPGNGAGVGSYENVMLQIDPRGETTVNYVPPGKWKSAAGAKFDMSLYMGFLHIGATTGPVGRALVYNALYGTGYYYDVKNEWALQLSGGGFIP